MELAADGGWADEFLAAENSLPEDAAWAAEFDATRPAVPSLHDVKWAAEYLDQSEQPEQHVWWVTDTELYFGKKRTVSKCYGLNVENA